MDWPILIDDHVIRQGRVIIGSGLRASKLLATTDVLAGLPKQVLPIVKPE